MALLLGAASSASRAELGLLGCGRGSSPQKTAHPQISSPQKPWGSSAPSSRLASSQTRHLSALFSFLFLVLSIE